MKDPQKDPQICISPGMHSIVRVEASHEGISMKDYTERALREFLKRNAKLMKVD